MTDLVTLSQFADRLEAAVEMQQTILDGLREDIEEYRQFLENNIKIGGTDG